MIFIVGLPLTQQSLETLGPFPTTLFADRRDKTLFVAGDGSLPYRSIVEVIDAAKGAGVQRVGIITDGMRRTP